MKVKVNLFTAIIVLLVGLYDLAVAFNRRKQPQKMAVRAYAILGTVFTIFGIGLVIFCLIKRG